MDTYAAFIVDAIEVDATAYSKELNRHAKAGYVLERITPIWDATGIRELLVTMRHSSAPTLAATIDAFIDRQLEGQRKQKQSPIEEFVKEKTEEK